VNTKLIVIYICAFIGPLGGNAVLALIPTLRGTFNAGEAEILLAITLFMLPFAVGQLFTGTIARVFSYQSTMVAGYTIYAVGSALGGGAPNITIFLACRVMQGIGFALISPITFAILGELTVPETRGRHMGLLNAAIGGGIFLGPIMAGFFAVINWRLAFYTLGLLGIGVAYLFWFTYRDVTFDAPPVTRTILRAEYISVLKSPKVILLCTAGFLAFFSLIGVMSLTAINISRPPFNIPEYELGLILASLGIAQIILALPGGLIVDWLGRTRTGIIGFIFSAVVTLFFLKATGFGHFIVLMALLGFGSVLVWAVLVTLSVEVVPTKKIYVASIFNSMRFFGYAAAPMILVGIYTGSGIGIIYLICAFTFAVNIVIMLLLANSKLGNQ
jgi:MFS family permease